MLTKELKDLMLRRSSPFVMLATTSERGEANVAPKLLFKYGRGCLYFVDVALGQTWSNLKKNTNVAMSFIDNETLSVFRLRGTAEILDSGEERGKYHSDIDKQLNKLIVDRIIEGEHRGKSFGNFIATVPKNFIVFKVTLLEIVEYGLSDLKTRKSSRKNIYTAPSLSGG